jgi:protease PrsW
VVFSIDESASHPGCSLPRSCGACIATSLSLPFNTAYFKSVDDWVAENPEIAQLLGPDATMMLAAPISAPIAEEIAKALGGALIFWLLRAEVDNMRDGIIYGALVGVGFQLVPGGCLRGAQLR